MTRMARVGTIIGAGCSLCALWLARLVVRKWRKRLAIRAAEAAHWQVQSSMAVVVLRNPLPRRLHELLVARRAE